MQQGVPRQSMMRCHAIQNRRQRPNPQRVVIGNGDVMLAMRGAGQPHMTARLACDAVPKPPKAFDQIRPDRSRGTLMPPVLLLG